MPPLLVAHATHLHDESCAEPDLVEKQVEQVSHGDARKRIRDEQGCTISLKRRNKLVTG